MGFNAPDLDALEFRSLIRRLALHRRAQIVSGYAVRETGKIFDLLNADQMAARDISFQNQRGKAIACCEQAGSQAAEPRADDCDVIVRHA